MMAEINFSEELIAQKIENNQPITLLEPCSGSGSMIIAFAQTMQEHKYNYQKSLFVQAMDIDETCFMMTFIQCALRGISARVVLGDTLAMKFKQIVYTPFYYFNGFNWKLRQHNTKQDFIKNPHTNAIENIKKYEAKQLSLFNV